MAPKCIVFGSLNGQIRPVFNKLAKLQPKQNFSFAIILGDLFGDGSTKDELEDIAALIQGNITVACPTYFTLGNRPLPPQVVEKIEATDEVCPNLFFLGKRGTLKTTDGIRIVALGGTMGETEGKSKPESNASGKFQQTYSESDARALFGIHKTDILITNQWPKDVRLGSSCEVSGNKETVPAELQCIADVCATLKPRYHFSRSDGAFFEREPFFHMPTEEAPDVYQLTRFISLPTFGSMKRAIYAFNLDPTAPFPSSIPIGATICPWSAAQSRRQMLPSQSESYQRFAPSDIDRDPGHNRRHKERAPPPGPENCFFCLLNPNIATHLITSIGNESYITTAKGPLPTKDFFPSLGFPGHMLIIPFDHCPTIDLIFDPKIRAEAFAEMQKYREAMHQMLNERSGGKLGAVTWEVSRSNGIHTHWQFLPMPVEKIRSRLVEMAFKKEASNLEYSTFKTVPNPDEIHNHHMIDYFRVFIWTPTPSSEAEVEGDNWSAPEHKGVWKTESGEENVIIMKILPEHRFNLQFGRQVMGKVLYLDERINWRDCVQTEAEETKDAEAFKEAFAKYDFAMGPDESI